ncbi:MAG TPA: hypothetical protein VFX59_12635 [Polyangiales bacterium]|nr:hypothetical protein [Polyangiales bacterium]
MDHVHLQLAWRRALGHAEGVPLTQQERLFIDHRRSRRHIGLYFLPIFLLIVLAVWGGLFLLWPTAVNPKAVWGAIEAGTIICGSGTLSSYATTATVLANVILLLLAATVVLRMAWSSHERRYLRVIEKLEKEAQALPGPTSAPVPPAPDRVVRQ